MAVITFDGMDTNTIIEYFMNAFKLLKVKIDISVIKGDNFNNKRGIDSLSLLLEKAKNQ
jgi:CTP:phosphocholine cytidylyltransferase-like protein